MYENRYGTLERILHRVAFRSWNAQVAMSDIEDKIFSKRIRQLDPGPPVFITALPRAGTTLLLELLEGTHEFVSHTYRNMPFVPLPLFWTKGIARFQTSAGDRERAHGDGMTTSEESPEAFGEILWRFFWSEQYGRDRIAVWPDRLPDRRTNEFKSFFQQHMRKVVVQGRSRHPRATRYLSKNNLNIARLPLLRRLFPDATIFVMLRHPLAQAASLLRQHLNFLQLHQADRFAREYMEAIGHYDFGANLRPIDFDGWLGEFDEHEAMRLGFWLRYWTAAYSKIAETADDRTAFVDLDYMCEHPTVELTRIAELASLKNPEWLIREASRIRALSLPEADATIARQTTYKDSLDLHREITSSIRRQPC